MQEGFSTSYHQALSWTIPIIIKCIAMFRYSKENRSFSHISSSKIFSIFF